MSWTNTVVLHKLQVRFTDLPSSAGRGQIQRSESNLSGSPAAAGPPTFGLHPLPPLPAPSGDGETGRFLFECYRGNCQTVHDHLPFLVRTCVADIGGEIAQQFEKSPTSQRSHFTVCPKHPWGEGALPFAVTSRLGGLVRYNRRLWCAGRFGDLSCTASTAGPTGFRKTACEGNSAPLLGAATWFWPRTRFPSPPTLPSRSSRTLWCGLGRGMVFSEL